MSIYINKKKVITSADFNKEFDQLGRKNLLLQQYRNVEADQLIPLNGYNVQYPNAIYLIKNHSYIVTADTNGQFTQGVDPQTDTQISMQFGQSGGCWLYMSGNIQSGCKFTWNKDDGWYTVSVNVKFNTNNANNLYMKNICVVDAVASQDDISFLQQQINQLQSKLGGVKPSYRLCVTSLKEVA